MRTRGIIVYKNINLTMTSRQQTEAVSNVSHGVTAT